MRILLADDHQILREGLKGLLARQPDMQVVGEAADGRTTVRMASELAPDVVVMDIGMPGLNGVEATRQIAAHHPGVRVIALSMHSDRRYVTEMLRAGAAGYLVKDSAFEELAQAVNAVAAGKVYLSPSVADAVVDHHVRGGGGGEPSVFAVLTPREREVLQLLAEGQATKQVAASLDVSVKTVETHRRQIMEKLDLHSVAELTKYAIREGLTSVEA